MTPERPWEGPDGHLFCRDLYVMLHEDGTAHSEIAYALSKPWKWVKEVLAWRASK